MFRMGLNRFTATLFTARCTMCPISLSICVTVPDRTYRQHCRDSRDADSSFYDCPGNEECVNSAGEAREEEEKEQNGENICTCGFSLLFYNVTGKHAG